MLPGMTNPESAPVTLASVLGRIRAYAKSRDWKPGRLASEAGLSRGTLARLFEPDFLPTSSTIAAIERVIPADWREGDVVPVETPDSPDAPGASAAGEAP